MTLCSSLLSFCRKSPVPLAVALLLPAPLKANDAAIGAPKAGVEYWETRHEAYSERAQEGNIGLLFLGDSITEGWKGQEQIWREFWGEHDAVNFGISGDLTQHVVWRIEHGELDGANPEVLVLMIGTNNTGVHSAAQIIGANRRIVELIREKLPETRIVLCALLPRGPWVRRGVLDKWEARMEVIAEVNPGLAQIAAEDEMITWLDMTPAFSTPEGLANGDLYSDWLHLNSAGYQVWAEQLAPVVASLKSSSAVPAGSWE